jgi:uncharacterized protein (DUF2336 family)
VRSFSNFLDLVIVIILGQLTLRVKLKQLSLTLTMPYINPSLRNFNLCGAMISAHPLVQLAGDTTRAAREALVSATADQFLDDARASTLLERTLFSDILVKLYSFARQEIRQRLSSALAMADWAPVELVRELALDTIDIAQPIISFCPVLNDDILIEVVRKCDLEHRVCIADRPCIGKPVSNKLIQTRNERVVATLAKNTTARIDVGDYKDAIDILRDNQDNIDVLVGRHDLPPSLIATAYALAGAQTRLAIALRLPPKLDQRLTRLTEFVASDAADGRTAEPLSADLHEAVRNSVRNNSPTPTPGFLLASLMRGERAAFFTGLARLLELPSSGVASKLAKGDSETIAIVARAANFDASVVRTVYEILQNEGKAWTSADDRQVAMIWMRYAPTSARQHFGASLKN